MKDDVKLCVESRKNVVVTSFELTSDLNKQLDELFERIIKLAETCSNAQDFETKFMSSELNQEYTDLYTDIAQSCKCKTIQKVEDPDEPSKGQKVFDEASSDAKYLAREISMPARRQARMKMDSKLRDTPLGKVEQASNMFHLFKRFKKPKKTDEISEE